MSITDERLQKSITKTQAVMRIMRVLEKLSPPEREAVMESARLLVGDDPKAAKPYLPSEQKSSPELAGPSH